MINLDYTLAVTILYVVVLYAFMSQFFFKPIARVLHDRRKLIEGRLQAAQQSVANADKKTQEYEQLLKTARADSFRNQEIERDRALAEKTELLTRTKSETDKTVQEARTRLQAEAQTASATLDNEVAGLAKELTTALLQGKS